MKEKHVNFIRSIPLWILIVLFIISVVLIVIPTTLYFLSNNDLNSVDYGITFDASSSATKIALYDWNSLKENGTGHVLERASEKRNIPIDKYANNLTDLVSNLTSLLEKSSNKINNARQSFKVPIYLGATAGMRLLNISNSQDSDRVLSAIKASFQQYTDKKKKFRVENVEIISGEKEGLYAWISANYLMDYIPPRNRPINSTVGILEMGGASAQIAFQTLCKTKDGCMREEEVTNLIANEKVELFDLHYDVYTYSNLCFGNDAAKRRYQLALITDQRANATLMNKSFSYYINDPCTHPGQMNRIIDKNRILEDGCTISNDKTESLDYAEYVFNAKPDIKRCQELTKNLVHATYVKEHFAANETIFNFKTMEEAPPADMPFYALSTYYYAMSQLIKNGTIHFEDEYELRKKINNYCARPWNDLIKEMKDAKYVEKEIEYLQYYCFSMNYIFMNLKHVYKFSGKQFGKIEFRQELDRGDLSWTLGYMLQATTSMQTEETKMLGVFYIIPLLVLGLLIGLLAAVILFFAKSTVHQTGNPSDSSGQIEIGLSNRCNFN